MVFLWFSIWFSIKPPFSYGFPMVLYHSAMLRLARGTRRQRRRPQTTTAASSTRSVASAADSNSAPWRWFKQPGLINNGEEHEHYIYTYIYLMGYYSDLMGYLYITIFNILYIYIYSYVYICIYYDDRCTYIYIHIYIYVYL